MPNTCSVSFVRFFPAPSRPGLRESPEAEVFTIVGAPCAQTKSTLDSVRGGFGWSEPWNLLEDAYVMPRMRD